MKLIYQPLKVMFVTQKFGNNGVCVNNTTGALIGCDGYNPPEGFRSLYGDRGHLGVDLAAGSRVRAFCAQIGVVYDIDTNEKSGLDVRIESEVNGRKFRHIYEHLSRVDVEVGDVIETGQQIGIPGMTGYATGEHLHFQVEEFIQGQWTPIDPMTVMVTVPATKVLAINNTLIYATEAVSKLADDIARFLKRSTVRKVDLKG